MNPTFSQKLITWQKQHGRHNLAWQVSDPYQIWLSEIMLQQTQVITVLDYFPRFTVLDYFPRFTVLDYFPRFTVLDYFPRFVAKFPTIQDFARKNLFFSRKGGFRLPEWIFRQLFC